MALLALDLTDAPPEWLVDKYGLRDKFMRKIDPLAGNSARLTCTLVRIIQPGEPPDVSLPSDFVTAAEQYIRTSLQAKGFSVMFEPSRSMTEEMIIKEMNELALHPR